MADIDVAALGLASPPTLAPKTTYTPAILVKNNGRAAAVATGYLQLFNKLTGVLIKTYTLASSSIGAGNTGSAVAGESLDWSGEVVGTQYLFAGYVTCEGDMVPANNVLAPVTVTIVGTPPPPPPVVTAHATQHEAGGTDELDIDGLHGELSDEQKPKAHAVQHGVGGDDLLSVEGLSGELVDPQPPKTHGNTAHTEAYATSADIAGAITDHDEAAEVHANASTLEHTGAKGQPGGYPSLDENARVPAVQLGGATSLENMYLRSDQIWVNPIGGVLQGTWPGRTTAVTGSAQTVMRSDDRPRVAGCIAADAGNDTAYYDGTFTVLSKRFFIALDDYGNVVDFDVFFRIVGNSSLTIQAYGKIYQTTMETEIGPLTGTTHPGSNDELIRLRMRVVLEKRTAPAQYASFCFGLDFPGAPNTVEHLEEVRGSHLQLVDYTRDAYAVFVLRVDGDVNTFLRLAGRTHSVQPHDAILTDESLPA